jgi:hypothetical protein
MLFSKEDNKFHKSSLAWGILAFNLTLVEQE